MRSKFVASSPVVRGKVRGKDALEAWHNNEAEATVIFKRKPPSSPDSVMELPSVSIKEFSLEPSLIKRETVDQGDADDATHSTRRDRPHAQIHSRATKCAKAKAQGLMEKRWVRGRAARRADHEACLAVAEIEQGEDKEEEEAEPVRASRKVRDKARRAQRRAARDAKSAAPEEEACEEPVVFVAKGWVEPTKPSIKVVKEIMYLAPGSPVSAMAGQDALEALIDWDLDTAGAGRRAKAKARSLSEKRWARARAAKRARAAVDDASADSAEEAPEDKARGKPEPAIRKGRDVARRARRLMVQRTKCGL
jgi:hypothetical protein